MITLPIRLSSGAAEDVGDREDAEAPGMNTSAEPAYTPGQRQREGDPPEALPGVGAEVLRGVEQRLVVLLEIGVQRQHHERQVHVDEADEHRERAEQQRHGLDAERSRARALSAPRERRLRPEDDHPGVDADQEVAPERQDDEQQQQVAVALRAARDQQRQRIGEHEAEQRGERARTRTT